MGFVDVLKDCATQFSPKISAVGSANGLNFEELHSPVSPLAYLGLSWFAKGSIDGLQAHVTQFMARFIKVTSGSRWSMLKGVLRDTLCPILYLGLYRFATSYIRGDCITRCLF